MPLYVLPKNILRTIRPLGGGGEGGGGGVGFAAVYPFCLYNCPYMVTEYG